MHRRIEAAAGTLARLDRKPRHGDEVLPRVQHARAVERRELGVGAEARQQLLEPLELPLGPGEGNLALGARLGVQEELHLSTHRGEEPPLHHEVLVIVSGGRVTTRTDGAAPCTGADALGAACVRSEASEADRALAFAAVRAAISRLRSASCAR